MWECEEWGGNVGNVENWMEMWEIRVGMWNIEMGMRGIRVGMQGIRAGMRGVGAGNFERDKSKRK